LASDADLERLDDLTRQYGAVVLVVTRALPLLAEASVLLVGIHRLPWWRFWPPVLLSNLGIALAYAFFGEVAARNQWLPIALGVSLGLPVLLGASVRWWFLSPPAANSHDEEQF
jgi:3-dehydroquinate synthase